MPFDEQKLNLTIRMKLGVKRNSQANRLSTFFKGRKSSASGKQPTDVDETRDLSNTSTDSESGKSEEENDLPNSSAASQEEYLVVLHRILQEQIINTKAVYRLAGHTITVEVLEDTEL